MPSRKWYVPQVLSCSNQQRLPSNAADRKAALKTVRSEFKLVSEINNFHLIKYYGMEVHKVRRLVIRCG